MNFTSCAPSEQTNRTAGYPRKKLVKVFENYQSKRMTILKTKISTLSEVTSLGGIKNNLTLETVAKKSKLGSIQMYKRMCYSIF